MPVKNVELRADAKTGQEKERIIEK